MHAPAPLASLQERDLKLLRETLTGDEVAAALASRANMVIRKRGIGLEELDYRSVRSATLDVSASTHEAGAAGAGQHASGQAFHRTGASSCTATF
jgi:hypothetical protein